MNRFDIPFTLSLYEIGRVDVWLSEKLVFEYEALCLCHLLYSDGHQRHHQRKDRVWWRKAVLYSFSTVSYWFPCSSLLPHSHFLDSYRPSRLSFTLHSLSPILTYHNLSWGVTSLIVLSFKCSECLCVWVRVQGHGWEWLSSHPPDQSDHLQRRQWRTG